MKPCNNEIHTRLMLSRNTAFQTAAAPASQRPCQGSWFHCVIPVAASEARQAGELSRSRLPQPAALLRLRSLLQFSSKARTLHCHTKCSPRHRLPMDNVQDTTGSVNKHVRT